MLAKAIGEGKRNMGVKGTVGSFGSLLTASVDLTIPEIHVIVKNDKEAAAYFMNDLEQIFGEADYELSRKKVLLFPTAYKKAYDVENIDNDNILMRTEVLKRINTGSKNLLIVTFPEALSEKVVTKSFLSKNTMKLKVGEEVDLDFVHDLLLEFNFHEVDFVAEPGEFSIRGGIVDVFSFANDLPFRIEFFGDEVESIRSFDIASQRSVKQLSRIQILPNMQLRKEVEKKINFLEYVGEDAILWIDDLNYLMDKVQKGFEKAESVFKEFTTGVKRAEPRELFSNISELSSLIERHRKIDFSARGDGNDIFVFNTSPQPVFSKNFDLLIDNLEDNSANHIKNFIFSENPKQLERLKSIIEDLSGKKGENPVAFEPVPISFHEGFIDYESRIACYTDHQIFERYHRFHIKERFSNKESLTLKELYDLQPGDFVTHIDHGIGKFGGLEKIVNNGVEQEAIRLHYKNGDLLYVSIHSLHRISKYTGKDGTEPTLSPLGSKAWKKLKESAKSRVKDIARELIALYAKRKSTNGYAFTPDSFLQNELEASFIYEDTPDQYKATNDVKKDMESEVPMDRLICGDVGFGKTEIAIRAAFKAAADGKQAAVLVPTTVLALQHHNTFSERLKEFPVKIEYLNRFKTSKEQKEIINLIGEGKIDIIIGTHRLVSKDVVFKDLGLLIIDEEQKFGVSVKEKLKNIKVNVDTLTLTATPIPRTLQFSLMGARDLSIINTPPPNRYPVQTEIHTLSEDVIRDAINYEISRRGQIYIINNRIQNIYRVADVVKRLVPKATVAVAHGQMPGHDLEKIMLEFIRGDFDVLISTTIIESGLDIPNANTMIIYDAQNFGLSDLHQLRGRVGRSNKKAFCYLLAPPISSLSDESRKRLKAIEEFSTLGSGFNIAMRDLDIRGAGNILGAEQSGFITEIGYEMYHQILDEAVSELKETEFKDLFADQLKSREYVSETKIETDLSLLIPNDYVFQSNERLSLYKKLNSLNSDLELDEFKQELEDRFGPAPEVIIDLMDTIRLRRSLKRLGFEKVSIKQDIMIAYLVSNKESDFYNSDIFNLLLAYLQKNMNSIAFREKNDKLSLSFKNIGSVQKALRKINEIEEFVFGNIFK